MSPPWTEGATWLGTISGAFATHQGGSIPFGASPWTDPASRSRMVARARWVFLAVLGAYGIFLCAVFAQSGYGFFLTWNQTLLLGVSLAGVAHGNAAVLARGIIERWPRAVDPAQILMDLVFITVLIHVSGGAASWFWPAYLIVTIEASFLLPRQRDVWIVGMAGGLLHGLALAANHTGLLAPAGVPFAPSTLNGSRLYLLLVWSWVGILNTSVALISAYLMSVIRWDHRALKNREAQLQEFVDTANDLIVCLARDGRFLYVNPVWMKATGHDLDSLGAKTFFDLVDLEHRARTLREFRQAFQEVRGVDLEAEILCRDGSTIAVEGHITPTQLQGRARLVWCICRDVTARREAEAQLYRMAHFDSLTGLPNRTALLGRLDAIRGEAEASGSGMAVLFVDLDRFKLVNDSLGHQAGDKLLQSVATRLQGIAGKQAAVCRLGGDEFVVGIGGVQDPKDLVRLARQTLGRLSRPIQIGNQEVFITASIGVSVFPEDARDLEALVQKADIAMYHAKSQGRNTHQRYTPDMDAHLERRLLLLSGLRRALESGEFLVYYQPKVEVESAGLVAVEALVRWAHPTLGLLAPTEFIPLAEECGLILELGEWVLREACAQAVTWMESGLPPCRMGVNLSGHQLQQADLPRVIGRILEESGLPAERLELEITETVVMQNPALAVRVLDSLRALGIHISVDDFGTGYSSLAQLKQFPIHTLKIDKSFIREIEHNPTDAAIVSAIIAMGASLGLEVVAEGVETPGQLGHLRSLGCTGAQGFLFGEAVHAREIPALMRRLQASLLPEGVVA